MPLPAWVRSIRFRLALTYALLAILLGAVTVGLINLAVTVALADEPPLTRDVVFTNIIPTLDGFEVQRVERTLLNVERLVEETGLATVRRYSIFTLLALIPTSFGVGWWAAGRALRPVQQITEVAREIQSTDLSRRIRLEGPDDELHRLADTFDEMLDRLQQGVVDQRSFIEDTTHELRNPLAVMATSLDVALADPDADAVTLRQSAEVVRRTIDRTSRTVDELIAFARQDQSRMAHEPVALGRLVEEAVSEYRGAASARGITIEAGSAAVVAEGDYDSLKRALGNLLDNAVRLAPESSTIWCGAGHRARWAWIAVRDEGPGIAAGIHARIFERAWGVPDRHDRTRTRSGLGLAIVRQVMASHRGVVTVSSAEGAGSTFTLWLPLDRSARPDQVTDDGVHPLPQVTGAGDQEALPAV
jgi:signal transduction histidine kinase